MTRFERLLGIDYSGAGEVDATISGLAVFETDQERQCCQVTNQRSSRRKRWSRKDLAEWLIDTLTESPPALVGLDHAFSLPFESDWEDRDWDGVLRSRTERWRTHQRSVKDAEPAWRTEADRMGGSAYRLTDRWTSSARSVWDRRPNGVFHSTVAGIPWLHEIRRRLGNRVHFWPFDGWRPPSNRHVIIEVYPALFWRRYPVPGKSRGTSHERDARAVCWWMQDMADRGALAGYFSPPLTDEEKRRAEVEGWIFGVA